ncbi:MAG TPA: sigma-54-dependent Fis family transcriptional regulator [Rhodanobacteraceae bacterium]|nr:sigma-54-dependent Fis family transcriptional regulator [Rhodanobacteraceae bacterium]
MSRHSAPNGLTAARRRFFAAGERPTGLVPSVILASWQRCAALGLAADARPAVEPMAASALHELKDRYELLRRVCRPELETLHVDARATGAIAILTGPDGFVLDAIGSADFLDKAARVSLRPGVPWREDATGTNAIGTALVEKRPVEVRGGEHYFEPHRILSCSAAPILDPFGGLAGVLDLSGEASVHHVHALGMVGLAVEQIEHRLFGELCAGRDVVRIQRDAALLGTAREGLLVFEGHRLVAANRHALELLGIGWDELGRRRYDELFAGALPGAGCETMLRDHLGTRLHARRDGGAVQVAIARAPVRRVKPARTPRPFFDANAEADIERGVRLLDADIPILLHGETGTGKEVLARELHKRSQRAGASFVAINCASLPESLIEAELFGYVHGAFTGARREGAQGLLREANGGVLFLDEIGDMPLSLQSRLLRVLQEREVTPLGGGRAVPVDFALIAASHRDLGEAIEARTFRADLYFRIAQNTFSIPPLRARTDLRALILALWNSLGAAAASMRLDDAALAALEAHRWPGNVRELVGVLRTLIALGDAQSTIGVDALPVSVRVTAMPANASLRSIAGPDPSSVSESIASLGALQRDAMRQALAACGGNTSEAARRLGVSRSTLYRHLRSR